MRNFILLIILSCAIPLSAQVTLSTKSKAAKELYISATKKYDINDFKGALEDLEKAVTKDPKFVEAHMLMGDIYADTKEYDKGIVSYSAAIKVDPEYYRGNYFNLALCQMKSGKYDEAIPNFQKYKSLLKNDPAGIKKIELYIKSSEFAANAVKNPVPFIYHNMGDSINSPYDEYLPTITADEQTLIFTRREPADQNTVGKQNTEEEDFYVSKRINGSWSKAVNLGPPINTNANEGAQCISPDGQYIFYTACNRNGGYGSCDLYYTRKQGSHWENPVNMGSVVNSKQWDTQPSLSSDGKTLYFISTREGGLGSSDVWKTTLDDNGEWTKPVNLGAPVNTPGKELSPFIHPDNQTLYFASDGHIGMGGLDMYYTRIDSTGKWTTPVNLGYPINTVADESSMIVSASGMMAYFASNSFSGNGRYDLYGFELYEKARPRVVTYLKGIVFDKTNLKRLGARFQLIDLKTKEIVVESESDPVDGTFLVCIPTNKEYALHVTKGNDYIFYSDNFYVKGNFESSKPFLKDIPLEPVSDGSKFILRNIFFDFDQSTLRSESYVELEKLQKFLKDNPNIKVEIGGHTDSNGDDAYNMKLSAARAKTVVDYLITNGITKDRMTFKGYGETMPIIKDAKTDEEHQMNRRTEIKIISH